MGYSVYVRMCSEVLHSDMVVIIERWWSLYRGCGHYIGGVVIV